MQFLGPLFTILTIGAVGGIIYTVLKNPDGVKAVVGGLDSVLKTSYAAELGKVA